MQTLTTLLSVARTRLWLIDRRVKAVVVLALLVFLVVVYIDSLLVFVPHFWMVGRDVCAVINARSAVSSWIPRPEKYWHKLCKLEQEFEKLDYVCKDLRRKGNRDVCFDSGLVPTQNCIVYSFGIAYDFRFDDAMARMGCTVYSFDPSMKDVEHTRGKRVFFKTTGLAARDDDHFHPRMDGYVKVGQTEWRMRRLASIMKELGHEQGAVSLLKIDIESYEWDVVADLLSTPGLLQSIPQILIEWHIFADSPPRDRYDELSAIYRRFKDTGYRKFHWNNEGRNHEIKRMRTQAETSWVNQRFLEKPREKT